MSQTTRVSEIGTIVETEKFIAMFGNRNASIEALAKTFPQISFARIKQVHGNTVVESLSTDSIQTADAHWTNKSFVGLCVVTADCTPILIYSENNVCCAIHAGWRGVESRILPLALKELQNQNVDLKKITVLIGPHILFSSFEVDRSVWEQLIKSTSLTTEENVHWQKLSNEKYLVNLLEIIKLQLLEFNFPLENLVCDLTDTKTNVNYHSFRRDKDQSGRQLSFICLKL